MLTSLHTQHRPKVASKDSTSPSVDMKDRIIRWVNQLLFIDVCFVIVGFLWFLLAVLGRSIGIPLGLDLLYSLWQPVFTPAIGIVIAATLLTGLIDKVSKRMNSN